MPKHSSTVDSFNVINIGSETDVVQLNPHIGIGTNNPSVSVEINTTDSIKIPKGNTNERPSDSSDFDKGFVRYNTELEQFEGFGAGNRWRSLEGVIDTDQDTYIIAESNAEDNDELQFYTNGDQRMIIKDDGKIGIGTDSPTHKLEVEGDIKLSGNLYKNNVLFSTDDLIEGSSNLYYTESLFNTSLSTKSTNNLSEGSNLYYTEDRVDSNIATKNTNNLTEGSSNLYYTDDRVNTNISNKNIFSHNSNIGVGIQPTEKLDIDGNVLIRSNLRVKGNIVLDGVFSNIETHTQITDQLRILNEGTGPGLIVHQTGNEDIANFMDDNQFALVIKNLGNVGIGTDTPSHKLQVEGDIKLTGNLYKNNELFTTDDLTEGSSNLYYSHDNVKKLLNNGITGGIISENDIICKGNFKKLLTEEPTVITNNLVAHYKFDGDDVADSSGNGNDLESVSLDGTLQTDFIYPSLKIPENNKYLFPLSITETLMTQNWSISFYVKIDSTNASSTSTMLFGIRTATTEPYDDIYMIAYSNSSGYPKVGFNIWNDRTQETTSEFNYYTQDGSVFVYDTWYYITLTMNKTDTDTTVNFYNNGTLIDSQTKTTNFTLPYLDATMQMALHDMARDNIVANNDDKIIYYADFRIYDKALSATEVFNLYNHHSLVSVIPLPTFLIDFEPHTTQSTWTNYINSLQTDGFVQSYDLNYILNPGYTNSVFKSTVAIGYIDFIIPSGYDSCDITYGREGSDDPAQLKINDIDVDSTNDNIKTYKATNLVSGQIIRIYENHGQINRKIKLFYFNTTPQYKNITFTHDGSTDNQTEYTVNFPEDTTCDILLIAGGGSGGSDRAGGAGAGSCIVYKDYVMNGNYKIKVGKSGNTNQINENGNNGYDSEITNQDGSTVFFRSKGGGGGGKLLNTGLDGGCGGGSGSQGTDSSGMGGNFSNDNIVAENQNISPSSTNNYVVYGNIGGRNTFTFTGNYNQLDGSGGGGIGESGTSSGNINAVDAQNIDGGKGGDGLYKATINGIDYNFKDHFSLNGKLESDGYYYIGGGGGGGDTNSGSAGDGGKGGGGAGGEHDNHGNNATSYGAGGGGAGGRTSITQRIGGNGFEGVIVIRYKTTIKFESYSDNKVEKVLENKGGTNITWNLTTKVFDCDLVKTDDLTEGTSNLYYTDDRVNTNISNKNIFSHNSNIGIGIQPTEKLDIDGNVLIRSNLRVQGDILITGDFSNIETHVQVTDQFKVENSGTGPALVVNQTGSNNIIDIQDEGISVLFIKDGGNVGIGTNNPNFKLDVSGDINIPLGSNFKINGTAIEITDTTVLVSDTAPKLGGNLDVNGKDIVSTSDGNINIDTNGNGDFVIKGNATKGSGSIKLNCGTNNHGITLKGPPHSASADYTLTFPDNVGTPNQVLSTDGNGILSFITLDSAPASGNIDSDVIAGMIIVETDIICKGNFKTLIEEPTSLFIETTEQLFPPTPPTGLPIGDDDNSQTSYNFDLMEATNMIYPDRTRYETENTIVGFSQIINNGLYEFRANNAGATNGKFYRLFTNDINNWYMVFGGFTDSNGLYNTIGYNDHDLTVFSDGSSQRGIWVEVGMPNKIILTKYSFRMNDNSSNRNIRSMEQWIICGSNDRITWTIIHNVPSDIVAPDEVFNVPDNQVDLVYKTFDTPEPYKYIRKIFIKMDDPTWFAHSSLKLYGKNEILVPAIPIDDNTNLITHFKFDDDLIDVMGNSVLTIDNGTEDYQGGKIDKSLNITDSGYKITSTTLVNLFESVSNSWSVSFWFNRTTSSISVKSPFLSRYDSGGANPRGGFEMALNTNGTLMFERLLTSGWLYIESDFVCSASNDWIHVVCICQPNKLQIYVNGSLDKEGTNNLAYSSTSVANNDIVGFGLRWRSNSVISTHDDSHGYIDDFRIYDKALSATEVSNLYNSNVMSVNITHKTLTFEYKPTNLIFTFREDESPYSWQEAYDEAIANGKRMPTKTELLNYLEVNGTLYPGQDIWCAVVAPEYSNSKDWIQIGNSSHNTGTSHTGDLGTYPSWGDNTTSSIARFYCEVIEEAQTEYSVNFPEETVCDILIVGGGGSGADESGGGGGGGGVIVAQSIILNGIYNIKVGKGGDSVGNNNGNNGKNSELEGIIALGGGGGRGWRAKVGHDGGSGGGGGSESNTIPNTNGSSTQSKDKTTYGFLYTLTDNGQRLNIYGEDGGDGGAYVGSQSFWDALGGGGGGANQVGYSGTSGNGANAGKGGDGIYLGDIFGDTVGENGYFAGGGGAASDGDMVAGLPGLGGGGQGYGQVNTPNINGKQNTGGGGGGAYRATLSGSGGSGIVIIRYSTHRIIESYSDNKVEKVLENKGGTNITWNLTTKVFDCDVVNTDKLPEGSSNLYYTETLFNTALSSKTTDNLTEGTSNLYYTETLFNTALSSKTTDNLTEGTSNLYYTETNVKNFFNDKITSGIIFKTVEPNVIQTNLVIWYKLDGNYEDSSGNGNTLGPQGNPQNGLTFNTSGDNNFPYSHWAYSTQTANQAWATSPSIDIDVPITIAFWFRKTGTTNDMTIMSYGDFPIGSIQFDINGTTLNIHTALPDHWTTVPSYTGINNDVWYHCVYVLTNENPVKTYLYVDGIQRSTGTGSANSTLMTAVRMTIANSGDGGRGFEGDIGDFRFYNRALLATEISNLYNHYSLVIPYSLYTDDVHYISTLTGMGGWTKIKHSPINIGKISGNTFSGSTITGLFTIGDSNDDTTEWAIAFDAPNVKYFCFHSKDSDINNNFKDRWVVIERSEMIRTSQHAGTYDYHSSYPHYYKTTYKPDGFVAKNSTYYTGGRRDQIIYNRNASDDPDPMIATYYVKKDGFVIDPHTNAADIATLFSNVGHYLMYRENGTNQLLGIEQGVYVKYTDDINPSIPEVTHKTLTFTHDGSTDNQTEYTVNFPEATTCDILIVGGGGGGGKPFSGGGGGGEVIYFKNKNIPSGNYTIKVGKGGSGSTDNNRGSNGEQSEAFLAISSGGGGGGGNGTVNGPGLNGGCGGGSGYNNTTNGIKQLTDNSGTDIYSNWGGTNNQYGGDGNDGGTSDVHTGGGGFAGGGGGAGGSLSSLNPDGNDGIQINIDGNNYYWAGGGGGYSESATDAYHSGDGGKGGGGGGSGVGGDSNDGQGGTGGINIGGPAPDTSSGNGGAGGAHTGGGGGGTQLGLGGNGGSGIVIIRYSNYRIFESYSDNKVAKVLENKGGTNITWNLTTKEFDCDVVNTDKLPEGSSNLYYTETLFDISLSSKTTNDLTEGSNLYYTDTRFDTRLETKNIFSDNTNIGIGTQPIEKLDIDGNVLIRSNLRVQGDILIDGEFSNIETHVQITDQFKVENSGTGPALVVNQTGSNDIIDIQDEGISVLFIKDGGNVGIGTTDPTQKLHIQSSNPQILIGDSSSGSGQIYFGNSGHGVGRKTTLPHFEDGNDVVLYTAGSGGAGLKTSGGYLKVSSAGNVGIGTTNPIIPLQVGPGTNTSGTSSRSSVAILSGESSGASELCALSLINSKISGEINNACSIGFNLCKEWSASAKINAICTATNGSADLIFNTYDSTLTEKMRIGANGNVGIGTNNPSYELDVDGDINCTGNFKINGSDITQYGDSDVTSLLNSGITGGLKVTSGNVGIGTNNPSYKLDVDGDINCTGNFKINGSDILYTDSDVTSLLNSGITGGLKVTSGNVGIGTTSPSYELDVYGDINCTGNFKINGSVITQYGDADVTQLLNNGITNGLKINSGNVGIGTSNPQSLLDVNGEIKCSSFKLIEVPITATSEKKLTFTTGGIYNTTMEANGDLRVSGDITAFYSDERLKHKTDNITNVLSILDNINVFKYENNDLANNLGFKNKKSQIGLSAQEINKYYPELVELAPFDSEYNIETNKNISKSGENYLTLKYDRLVPILLQGIKELHSKNIKLENDIELIKSKVGL